MIGTNGAHLWTSIQRLDLCQRAPQEHIQCLFKSGEARVYAPGEVIVGSGQEANGVYLVLEGTARMVYWVAGPPTPRFAVVDIVGSGGLYGLVPALDGEPYVAQLEAVTEAKVLFVPKSEFDEELRHHPEVAISLLCQLASLARKAETWLMHTL